MSMVGRRNLLKAATLAPLARTGKHKHTHKRREHDPVGWNQQNVFASLVVIYGDGMLGLFEYNGRPANGNPPIFWAVPPGVTEDPAGNSLVVSGGAAVAAYSGGIAQHGAWLNPNTGSVQAIVDGAAETWHNVSFSGTFSSTGTPFAPVSFQFEPVGVGRVRLRGQVELHASEPAGTIMFSLNPLYVPASEQYFVTANTLSGYAAGEPSVIVAASGEVSLGSNGSVANTVNLDGIVIELD